MLETKGMNRETKQLFKIYSDRFPTAGIGVFQKTVKARLKGKKIDENYKKLSVKTASMLESLFMNLSEEDLREWVFGLLMQEPKGICQRAIEEM